jgi:tRNA-binding EMAP/Myf-like protein
MADISQYKVGIVLSVEECSSSSGKSNKTLRVCQVNVGQAADVDSVTIVTSASNVRPGSRVAVALAGSSILNEQGEEMQVKKTIVGGVASEGMLCDSRMLGWSGGAAGVAAQMPDYIPIGDAPPSTKPRPNQQGQQDSAGAAGSGADSSAAAAAPGLFEKKLTKEEKKKLAEEKRKAKKAAKEAKSTSEE